MDPDSMLVLGLAISVLAINSLLSAFAESLRPRAGAIMVLIGGMLVVLALTQKPSGYAFTEIPEVVFSVIWRFIN